MMSRSGLGPQLESMWQDVPGRTRNEVDPSRNSDESDQPGWSARDFPDLDTRLSTNWDEDDDFQTHAIT